MRPNPVHVLALTAVLAPALPAAAQTAGEKLFAQTCAACHQPTGKGIPGAFPALAGDKLVQGPAAGPIKVLLNGRGGMPTFRNDLSNDQIAAILTYVRSAWGNHAPPVSPAAVAALRGSVHVESGDGAMQAH